MEKAKWVDDASAYTTYKCSNCGKEPLYTPDRTTQKAYITLTPYCAYCVAKMEYKEEDDEL